VFSLSQVGPGRVIVAGCRLISGKTERRNRR
jgi:hypothetical protein